MFTIYNPIVVAATATIGGSLFGFDISSVSAFLNDDAYLEYFNSPGSIEQGGISASMAGGSFLGSLGSGFLSDRLGRRPVLMLAACVWMIGAAIQSSSQNVAQLICGRLIAGVAIGFASSQAPVYIAEVSPKRMRGGLVGMFQWAVTIGIMIMFYISYGCTFMNSQNSFRTAWGIQMIPGLIYLLLLLFLPESPRWLAAKGREDEALEIISQVNAKGNRDDPLVKAEWAELLEAIHIEQESKSVGYVDLFAKDSFVRTFVGMTAQMWQQLTGMNVMMYYIVYVFEMAGKTGNNNLVASSIQYVINVVMTVPALLFIDRWGRRPLLFWGAVIMTIWLFAVGGTMGANGEYYVSSNPNVRWRVTNDSAANGIIACSYLFVATYAPTWGPGTWVYVSELFPLRQRAKANGLCAAVNWAFNFALAFFVPPAFTNIQYRVYFVFGAFTAAAAIEVFFLYPETRGKSLEEIEDIWASRIPAWRTGSLVSKVDEEKDRIASGNEQGIGASHENESAASLKEFDQTTNGKGDREHHETV